MASIKNLKKDINYVMGDVIDYALTVAHMNNEPKKAEPIIDEAIEVFDELIASVNAKNVDNKNQHFKQIKSDLETKANALIDKVSKF
ncbi:MAG: hypothetical protein HWD82_04550 [Flavobacteriaceae bacterium]|nr:hypothetical protein [Flavobacteriaceae bacterium]